MPGDVGTARSRGPKREWRDRRSRLQQDPARIRGWHREGRITSKQADDWERIAAMTEGEFEALFGAWYPPGRQTAPAQWHDTAFNHPAQPVVGIGWHEARAYCNWLSAQTGRHFRLPSEAEWEAAARGQAGRRYAYGDETPVSAMRLRPTSAPRRPSACFLAARRRKAY